jgi:hypothetical protein
MKICDTGCPFIGRDLPWQKLFNRDKEIVLKNLPHAAHESE